MYWQNWKHRSNCNENGITTNRQVHGLHTCISTLHASYIIKALKYWGRMEFLISASQAFNSIYLRLKTDWKTNSIVDNQMLYQEFPKLYKISQGIVLKENWSCRILSRELKGSKLSPVDLHAYPPIKNNKVWKTLKITSLFFSVVNQKDLNEHNRVKSWNNLIWRGWG